MFTRELCKVTKEECPLLSLLTDNRQVCGQARGKELTDGYGLTENLSKCPMHVPANFKKPMQRIRAKIAYESWLERMTNE